MEALSHWRKGARAFKSLFSDRYKSQVQLLTLSCTFSEFFLAWHCLGGALQDTVCAQAVHEQAGVARGTKSSCK